MKKFITLSALCIALFVLSCQENPVVEDDNGIVLSVQRGDKIEEISSIDFSGGGGTQEVRLSCQGSWSVNAAPSSWLSVSPVSGTDAATLTVRASVNIDRDSRLGVVVVTCGEDYSTLTINQSGSYLFLSSNALCFASLGGTDTLWVSSNVPWKVVPMAPWLTVSPVTGSNDGAVVVTAVDNPSLQPREAVVSILLSDIIEGTLVRMVAVRQDSRQLTVGASSLCFESKGGSSEVVTVTTNGTFDVRADVDWLTFEKQDSSFVVIASDNATPSPRQAVVTVFLSDLTEGTLEHSITVRQAGILSGMENGHELINLELPSGTLWATMNVGATSSEDYGDYFAWGETTTKSDYSWSTYKWCNGSNDSLTKYNTSSSYGTVDNKTILEFSDDVARVNWGGSWRTPTDDEWTELRNTSYCTWTWTTQSGVNGYKVTSVSNGASIFLPAAGSSLNTATVGWLGYYWSSSLDGSYPDDAWIVDFNSSGMYRYFSGRPTGLSVRPVCRL